MENKKTEFVRFNDLAWADFFGQSDIDEDGRKELTARENLYGRIKEIKSEVNKDFTDIDSLLRDYEIALDTYIIEIQKKPPERYLEWIADNLDYVLETIDRKVEEVDAVITSEDEWRGFEAKQIPTPKYTIEEYENILDQLVADGKITGEQSKDSKNNLIICKAWNCSEVVVKNHGHMKYCNVNCANEHKIASKRFRTTGTFLRVKSYLSHRMESKIKESLNKEVYYTESMFNTLDEEDECIVNKEMKSNRSYESTREKEIEKYRLLNKNMPVHCYIDESQIDPKFKKYNNEINT